MIALQNRCPQHSKHLSQQRHEIVTEGKRHSASLNLTRCYCLYGFKAHKVAQPPPPPDALHSFHAIKSIFQCVAS